MNKTPNKPRRLRQVFRAAATALAISAPLGTYYSVVHANPNEVAIFEDELWAHLTKSFDTGKENIDVFKKAKFYQDRIVFKWPWDRVIVYPTQSGTTFQVEPDKVAVLYHAIGPFNPHHLPKDTTIYSAGTYQKQPWQYAVFYPVSASQQTPPCYEYFNSYNPGKPSPPPSTVKVEFNIPGEDLVFVYDKNIDRECRCVSANGHLRITVDQTWRQFQAELDWKTDHLTPAQIGSRIAADFDKAMQSEGYRIFKPSRAIIDDVYFDQIPTPQ